MLKLSARQKREVYSVSSLLLHLIIFFVLLVFLNSCDVISCVEEPEPRCNTNATVEDLGGLDGCRYVLVLENGERLEPVQPDNTAGQESPFKNFTLKNGQRVRISYVESPGPSICMVGKRVEITCITEVAAPSGSNN